MTRLATLLDLGRVVLLSLAAFSLPKALSDTKLNRPLHPRTLKRTEVHAVQ